MSEWHSLQSLLQGQGLCVRAHARVLESKIEVGAICTRNDRAKHISVQQPREVWFVSKRVVCFSETAKHFSHVPRLRSSHAEERTC